MSCENSLTVQNSMSPVYVASCEGRTDVVDVLVKAGADVNQTLIKVCQWCWKWCYTYVPLICISLYLC